MSFNSISIADPTGSGGRHLRLKGMVYERDFRFGPQLQREIEAASRTYRERANERVQTARESYRRGIEIKRAEHLRRHPREYTNHQGIAVKQGTNDLSRDQRAEHHTRSNPAEYMVNRPVNGYSDLANNLGVSVLPGGENHEQSNTDRAAGRDFEGSSRQGREYSVEPVRGKRRKEQALRADRREGATIPRRLQNLEGVLNDRAGKTTSERVRELTEQLQGAIGRAAEGARRIVNDVQNGRKELGNYLAQSKDFGQTVLSIERASQQLNESSRTLEQKALSHSREWDRGFDLGM